MNYRHAFHAGNFADVLKHVALALCLDRLNAKETPYRYIDTHAGVGAYDLTSDAALRSPESRDGVARGGYVLRDPSGGSPELIIIGTGSELQLAMAAAQALDGDGIPTRVVSLPCWERFDAS